MIGWKFASFRLFPDRHEIALDNDCILWRMPASVKEWLLARCGAHVVGLNARTLPWDYYGTPASELTRAHWRRLEPLVRARLRNDLPAGHP